MVWALGEAARLKAGARRPDKSDKRTVTGLVAIPEVDRECVKTRTGRPMEQLNFLQALIDREIPGT